MTRIVQDDPEEAKTRDDVVLKNEPFGLHVVFWKGAWSLLAGVGGFRERTVLLEKTTLSWPRTIGCSSNITNTNTYKHSITHLHVYTQARRISLSLYVPLNHRSEPIPPCRSPVDTPP